MKPFVVALLLIPAMARAEGFPLEWALLKGTARERLMARLAERGQTNEIALLKALADDDAVRTERAMRRLSDENGDLRLGRNLVRMLTASGRTADAQDLGRILQAKRPHRRKLSATPPTASRFSGKTPVVFLHGYNGNADTWRDFLSLFLSEDGGYGDGDVIVFQYYDDDDNSSDLTEGLTTFGYDTDAKIAELAFRVECAVTIWLRRRANLPDDDASHDAELPAVDWVCHSMGGLVFRNILRSRPGLVRRCVTLGTPHFGQEISGYVVIGWFLGHQAHEMVYGSSSLWDLAADWHFLDKRTDDILFVAGAADRTDDGLFDDGLISTFSATMQTADDPRFGKNTFFVKRIHSTSIDFLFDGIPALTQLSGPQDPLFRLVHGYLNDSGFFTDGGRPTQAQVLSADGCDAPDGLLANLVRRGALFVQVMDGVTNRTGRLESPVEYDPGTLWPDKVVESLTFANVVYEDGGDGLVRENGYKDEGCENGLVMLFGNIPTGDCRALIGRPNGSFRPKYNDVFHLAGGGTTLVRTRPGAARPMSAVSVADIDGKSGYVVVPNDWLVGNGLVNHAENLSGCVAVSGVNGANGYPVAASYVLGLDPADAESTLRIASLTVGDGLLFDVVAGNRSLAVGEAPVVLQAKSALDGGPWRTVRPSPGSWTLPLSSGRFFRAALGW